MFIPREAMPCNQVPPVELTGLHVICGYNANKQVVNFTACEAISPYTICKKAEEFANYLYEQCTWQFVETLTLQLAKKQEHTIKPRYLRDISKRNRDLYDNIIIK